MPVMRGIRMMAKVSRGCLAFVLGLLIAGCGGRQVDVSPAPPNLPDLPEYEVEVCGWATDQAAIECFNHAIEEGRGAEIFSQPVTVEGDPIYQIARATLGGDVEIYTDYSKDSYGAGGEEFSVQTCDGDEFGFVQGFFSTGSCGPVSFSW